MKAKIFVILFMAIMPILYAMWIGTDDLIETVSQYSETRGAE